MLSYAYAYSLKINQHEVKTMTVNVLLVKTKVDDSTAPPQADATLAVAEKKPAPVTQEQSIKKGLGIFGGKDWRTLYAGDFVDGDDFSRGPL